MALDSAITTAPSTAAPTDDLHRRRAERLHQLGQPAAYDSPGASPNGADYVRLRRQELPARASRSSVPRWTDGGTRPRGMAGRPDTADVTTEDATACWRRRARHRSGRADAGVGETSDRSIVRHGRPCRPAACCSRPACGTPSRTGLRVRPGLHRREDLSRSAPRTPPPSTIPPPPVSPRCRCFSGRLGDVADRARRPVGVRSPEGPPRVPLRHRRAVNDSGFWSATSRWPAPLCQATRSTGGRRSLSVPGASRAGRPAGRRSP